MSNIIRNVNYVNGLSFPQCFLKKNMCQIQKQQIFKLNLLNLSIKFVIETKYHEFFERVRYRMEQEQEHTQNME